MRKYVKSNDGYALVIALLVITVVTVLGLGILTTTSSSKKLSEEENKDQTAYYIAEAGLNQKKEELKEIPNLYNEYIKNKEMKEADIIKAFLKEIKNKPILNKETIYREDIFKRKNAEAKVIVTIPSETELKFTITSTGIIKSNDSSNEKKRTVQSVDSYKLAITEKPAEEEFGTSKYVVHALGNLSITNGKVVGNLGFAQPQTTSNTFPFIGNAGDAYYIGGTSNTVYKSCYHWTTPNLCEDKSYKDISVAVKNGDAVFNDSELPKIPDFPKKEFELFNKNIWDLNLLKPKPSNAKTTLTKNLSGDYSISSSSAFNDQNYNVSSNTVNLFIDKIESFTANFEGNGIINIYTNNDIELNQWNLFKINFSKNTVNIYSPKKIYLAGDGSITNAENISFYGNSIDLNNKLNLSNVGNANFYANSEIVFNDAGSINSTNLLLKTSNLSILTSPDINFNITNSANFYIHNKLNLSTSNKNFNISNWNIYYTGLTKPPFGNFQNKINFDFLYTGIDVPSSVIILGKIIIRGDGSKTSNSVNISGHSTVDGQYLYAPFSDVTLSGSGKIYGSVIGNNVDLSGGTSIIYKQPPPNNGGSTGGATGGGSIDSSLTPNSDGGSVEVNNP